MSAPLIEFGLMVGDGPGVSVLAGPLLPRVGESLVIDGVKHLVVNVIHAYAGGRPIAGRPPAVVFALHQGPLAAGDPAAAPDPAEGNGRH
jgi:hypothetical protein